MKCCSCGSDKVILFFEEKLPCGHCGEDNVIVYNFCSACGCVFKSLNGEVTNAANFTDNELAAMMNMDIEDVREVMQTSVAEAGPRTMDEMVHKCLKCNAVAFEVRRGEFKCSECDFEWEIL